jgi:outer membrane protein OmpA-like peptidoglycan-associated protein
MRSYAQAAAASRADDDDRGGVGRSVGYTPPSIELYLARKIPGPCGLDQLPSISFDFGSSTLDEAQGLELARVARCLTDKPFDEASLVLVGHTDPIGSRTYNLSLAYERAAHVKARLRDLGVAPDRVIVTAASESELPTERWDEARRVDMLITRTR